MIMKQVTKDMIIYDVVKQFPHSSGILAKHGMHCLGCCVATWETLEQAAQTHGIDVNFIITDLNKKR